jgi:HK97 family phage prohead protease
VSKREFRFSAAELRAARSGRVIEGYAATFNQKSEDLGGFREQIAPGAFTKTLAGGADVRCLINHDASLILGRTRSNLQLEQDNFGLHFHCELPDTQVARDTVTNIQNGLLDGCSFGMICTDDNWANDGNYALRTVLSAELFDVSVVTYPAYSSTSVEARSLRCFPDGIITVPTESDEDREGRLNVQLRLKLAEIALL